MNDRFWPFVFVALALYSVALAGIEAGTSHDYARQFYTDLEGEAPFYAVNTTLGVSLQWAAALLFYVCASTVADGAESRDRRRFYVAQAAIFAYTGFDDQFLVHEKLSWRLGISDAWPVLAAAAAETALLVTLGRRFLGVEAWRQVAVAGALFAGMMAIDQLAPSRMFLRLSCEDLAKSWAALFLFRYGWCVLAARLGTLRQPAAAPSPNLPVRLVAVR